MLKKQTQKKPHTPKHLLFHDKLVYLLIKKFRDHSIYYSYSLILLKTVTITDINVTPLSTEGSFSYIQCTAQLNRSLCQTWSSYLSATICKHGRGFKNKLQQSSSLNSGVAAPSSIGRAVLHGQSRAAFDLSGGGYAKTQTAHWTQATPFTHTVTTS